MDRALDLIRERAGAPADAEVLRLSGGDTCAVYRVHHPHGDRVVKHASDAGLLTSEARGLRALRDAGVPVPELLAEYPDALVLPWLEPGPPDWARLGRQVAQLHAHRVDVHGVAEPVYLGRFRFDGGTTPDPLVHLKDLRLRPLVRACRSTLGSARARNLEAWLDRLTVPDAPPCLVHGDLWSGNVLHSIDGPVLIDPSAQGAPRAYDLAMMRLFGGFPAAFWSAYEAITPIPDDVARSIPAYSLVFVLVHVSMFGSSYLGAVDQIVAQSAM